jgi:hypothetical protein
MSKLFVPVTKTPPCPKIPVVFVSIVKALSFMKTKLLYEDLSFVEIPFPLDLDVIFAFSIRTYLVPKIEEEDSAFISIVISLINKLSVVRIEYQPNSSVV